MKDDRPPERNVHYHELPTGVYLTDSRFWHRTGMIRFRCGGFFRRTAVMQVQESRMHEPLGIGVPWQRKYRWRDATFAEALHLDSWLVQTGAYKVSDRPVEVPRVPPRGGSSVQPPAPRRPQMQELREGRIS